MVVKSNEISLLVKINLTELNELMWVLTLTTMSALSNNDIKLYQDFSLETALAAWYEALCDEVAFMIDTHQNPRFNYNLHESFPSYAFILENIESYVNTAEQIFSETCYTFIKALEIGITDIVDSGKSLVQIDNYTPYVDGKLSNNGVFILRGEALC